MLGDRIEEHGANCWLVNTGWVGGGVGVGERIALSTTRRIVDAILSGELDNARTQTHPVFNLEVPKKVPGVESSVLDTAQSWSNAAEYDAAARQLAGLFQENFERFENDVPELASHGPLQQQEAEKSQLSASL